VATVLGGLVAFAACRSIEARRRGLILSLAILPLVALVLLGAAGKDIVIPRYAAEGIPFTLVALGAALARSPRPVAILLAAGTAVVGGSGLVAGERRGAFYADARGAVRTIAADARPGDAVVTTGRLVVDYPFRYYAVAGLPRGVRVIQPPLRAHPPRLWLLSTGGAAPPGYRLARFRHLAGDPPIDVLLLETTAR
jgi:hypothetical protein